MKRKLTFILALLLFCPLVGCGNRGKSEDGITRLEGAHTYEGYPVVYVTPDVSSQGLLSAYELLDVPDCQNVAIKLSNTKTDAGFTWADVTDDLFREFERTSVIEGTTLESVFSDYDSTIILSHFRGHDIVGFDGAVKQTAEISVQSEKQNDSLTNQVRMEQLAEAGKHTVDGIDGQILYITIMDRLTIESGGITLPESNTYDIGILSSYDPVALDQACIDLVYMLKEGKELAAHIESCNGIHTLVHAESIGLGSRTYALIIADH